MCTWGTRYRINDPRPFKHISDKLKTGVWSLFKENGLIVIVILKEEKKVLLKELVKNISMEKLKYIVLEEKLIYNIFFNLKMSSNTVLMKKKKHLNVAEITVSVNTRLAISQLIIIRIEMNLEF